MAPRREAVLWAMAAALALATQCRADNSEEESKGVQDIQDKGQSSGAGTPTSSQSSSELVQAALARGCASRYTMTCLKLDALSVLRRMAVPATYDLLPGVTIRRSVSESAGGAIGTQLPADLVQSLAADPPQEMDKHLDDFLMNRFGSFLDSHTVQVRLLDLQPVAGLKKVLSTSRDDVTGGADSSTMTSARGRRRNGLWQQLMGAGMMMGGSTLTMGLSALAAMAGKALMLSMLSLVLSAMSGLGGGGGGGGGGGHHSQKQTTYEIISKPIYTHGHSHSAELHHEPSGPAGYGLYGRSKDVESVSGGGTSGVGGSGIGGSSGTSSYISQYPRSLQDGSHVAHLRGKKPDDDKSSGSPVSNYDSVLIRNLQYVKGEDGRAKYSVAAPVDLIPSESDYGTDDSGSARKYAAPDDAVARSFHVDAGEDEGLAGVFDNSGGLVAGPRSMQTFARIPQLLVGEAEDSASKTHEFRSSPPDFTRTGWEAITPSPSSDAEGLSTSTARAQPDPAFVVAKPVAPNSQSVTPKSIAYRAYT